MYLSTTTGVLYGIGMVLHGILYYTIYYSILYNIVCVCMLYYYVCVSVVYVCVSLCVCSSSSTAAVPAYLPSVLLLCMYVCYTILHSMYVHRCMWVYTIPVCMYRYVLHTTILYYYSVLLYIVYVYTIYLCMYKNVYIGRHVYSIVVVYSVYTIVVCTHPTIA